MFLLMFWILFDVPVIHCEGDFVAHQSRSACDACRGLSHPKKVPGTIFRFAEKYYSAQLLRLRLFATKQEADEFAEKIAHSHFGQTHQDKWQKICCIPNLELQQLVKRAFITIPKHEVSPLLQTFLATVVQPSIQVHARSVSSSLMCLASQFLDALSKNETNAPWFASVLIQV